MTFEELDARLPNGFHDAAIRRSDVDFVERSVTLGMDLLVGEPADSNPELYRAGTLRLSPVYLCFMEPPDPHYAFIPNGLHLKVDGGSVKFGQSAQVDSLLPRIPKDATTYRFFLEKWNAFYYLSGGAVEFCWDDGEPLH